MLTWESFVLDQFYKIWLHVLLKQLYLGFKLHFEANKMAWLILYLSQCNVLIVDSVLWHTKINLWKIALVLLMIVCKYMITDRLLANIKFK